MDKQFLLPPSEDTVKRMKNAATAQYKTFENHVTHIGLASSIYKEFSKLKKKKKRRQPNKNGQKM